MVRTAVKKGVPRKRPAPKAESPQIRGTQEWIRVSLIFFDPAYQRKIDEMRVRSIAANFDPDSLGVIYLSKRENGTYACLDGSHRVSVLRYMGWEDQSMPSYVYEGLSIEDEARIFRHLNQDRARPKPLDLFRAQIAEGLTEAKDVAGILDSLGLRYDSYSATPGVVRCISSIMKTYMRVGTTPVRRALQTMLEAWGNSPDSLNGEVFKGLALFYAVYGGAVEMSTLVARLSEVTPTLLRTRAAQMRELNPDLQISAAFGAVILNVYNYRLRATSRLPVPWTVKGFNKENKIIDLTDTEVAS